MLKEDQQIVIPSVDLSSYQYPINGLIPICLPLLGVAVRSKATPKMGAMAISYSWNIN